MKEKRNINTHLVLDVKKFIMTSDKETADKMKSSGFEPVSYGGGMYIFRNDPKIKFDCGFKKYVYSDKMFFQTENQDSNGG